MKPRTTRQAINFLLAMSDEDFAAAVEASKSTRQLVRKAKTMTPPRRPRGEKPATTIRFLRRQIATLEQVIAGLRMANADKDKVIAGYDVQLSEADDAIREATRRADAAEHRATSLREFIDSKTAELEFFRGYYAKSQEIAPTISALRRDISDHQTQTLARRGAGDPQGVPHGEGIRPAAGTERHSAETWPTPRTGGPVRDQRVDNRPHPEGRKVEHVTITEGADLCPACLGSGIAAAMLPGYGSVLCRNCNGTGRRGG